MEKTSRRKWSNLFNFVIDSKQPFHLVTYEDLLRDPVTEMQKVMRFLEVASGFEQDDLQERLLCLSQNLQGNHKRTRGYYSTVRNYFPYYFPLKVYHTVISYLAKIPYVIVRYGIFPYRNIVPFRTNFF